MKVKLRRDETLRTVYRESRWILWYPVLVWVIVVSILLKVWFTFDLAAYTVLFFAAWIFITLYAARRLILWSMNAYILTSHRLIVITHHKFFQRYVQETPLDRILNVGYRTTGLFSSLCGFGTVDVQVVGLHTSLPLTDVSAPAKITDILWRAHEQALGKDQATQKGLFKLHSILENSYEEAKLNRNAKDST